MAKTWDNGGGSGTDLPPLHRVDLGRIPYAQALEDMAAWVVQRRADEVPDRLYLLSHPQVITYGDRTPLDDLPTEATAINHIPTFPVDRGGFATYHGPGQLIGYLVMNIRQRGPGDVVRWLENGLIKALAELGFDAVRRETPKGASSLVGVWTPDHRKIGSIGMRIRGGITSHGFALNIDPDMTVFEQFTVCGLHDVTMASLSQLAAEQNRPTPTDAQVRNAVADALGAITPAPR
ncbi:lipoyl(octanoyl) transferase LipB [Goodfellowiella coeruleoviolacea]|uniref:lipoyl(octanoyl) transferase LipB n=1 Tax=Goodfellowiella coeruleoviolacea TaxID=334858 RepID=UPI000AEC0AC4|nr:lipoyl(octanoyl) transferase LipB [Goodfellowiella coeruleoviolacea]